MDERIADLRRMFWALSNDVCAEIVSLQLRKIARAEYSQPTKERWLATLLEHKKP